jgi:hypothetical protein
MGFLPRCFVNGTLLYDDDSEVSLSVSICATTNYSRQVVSTSNIVMKAINESLENVSTFRAKLNCMEELDNLLKLRLRSSPK